MDKMVKSIYDITVERNDGAVISLREFRGKVLLIVNTASYCGFTPQYEELQTLFERYKHEGFTVLAFPCNQFGKQEPGSAADIEEFCQKNYHTGFPIFAKIKVNGPKTNPLFRYLKKRKRGFWGTGRIHWNFTKFLVDRRGERILRFAPYIKPQSFTKRIEEFLVK